MPPSAPTLFLFDIDGTLLSTSGSGYRSFTRSCKETLGIVDQVEGINMAGKLDRMIFQEIAGRYRPELAGEELAGRWLRFKANYIRYLQRASRNPRGWKLMPGVEELVRYSSEQGKLALLTGNVRDGALIKLTAFGLADYFPIGGFGEDNVTRDELAEQAFRIACSHYRVEFPRERTFVFGDTTHDIRAARAIQAKSVGVATGTVSAEDLARAGADLLVSDFLSGAEAVRRFISQ